MSTTTDDEPKRYSGFTTLSGKPVFIKAKSKLAGEQVAARIDQSVDPKAKASQLLDAEITRIRAAIADAKDHCSARAVLMQDHLHVFNVKSAGDLDDSFNFEKKDGEPLTSTERDVWVGRLQRLETTLYDALAALPQIPFNVGFAAPGLIKSRKVVSEVLTEQLSWCRLRLVFLRHASTDVADDEGARTASPSTGLEDETLVGALAALDSASLA